MISCLQREFQPSQFINREGGTTIEQVKEIPIIKIQGIIKGILMTMLVLPHFLPKYTFEILVLTKQIISTACTGKLIPGSSCLAAYLINLTCSFDLACTEINDIIIKNHRHQLLSRECACVNLKNVHGTC